MRYVLDTNIVIAALNGREQILDRLEEVAGEDVGIPVVAVAELLYGAHRSQQRDNNLAKVRCLNRTFAILPVTKTVAERYGETRAELESRGEPLMDFDLIIACTAIAHAAALVTNDRALHDHAIPGLTIEDWLSPTM